MAWHRNFRRIGATSEDPDVPVEKVLDTNHESGWGLETTAHRPFELPSSGQQTSGAFNWYSGNHGLQEHRSCAALHRSQRRTQRSDTPAVDLQSSGIYERTGRSTGELG